MITFFKNRISKLFHIKNSLMGKIVLLFLVIFLLMLIPSVLQVYTFFNLSSTYKDMIDNIAYTNRLSMDVSIKIEPVGWDIVAGKVGFEESGIIPLIEDIREQMVSIGENKYSADDSGIIEVSLRALSTLEEYVNRLGSQIHNRAPVAENENVLEEIRVCVALINDLLSDFSSMQLERAAVLNEEMSVRSSLYFIINTILILIVITTGIFAFWYISKSLMNPIEKLLDMSFKISKGDFTSRVYLAASDEFNELASGMNKMSEQIELLISKSVEEQKQLQMLEAKALQAQITPHFLYNTLDAIVWAAEVKNTSDVIKLVTSLSSFFRISLSHGIDFITISDEISHVKSYLIIQQIRYSDILTYDIHVDEGLGSHLVLKLLLQPIVENALYHGIKNTRERGSIKISVTKCSGGVCFSVKDNGIGMTQEELEALRAGLDNNEYCERGYGLFNVNRRLKLYYGITKGIKVDSEYKKGTEVSFVLNILP